MNIAVIDTTETRRTTLAQALRKLQEAVLYQHDGVKWTPNQPESIHICFFHSSDSGLWKTVEAVEGIADRVFWYSSTGVRLCPNPPGVGQAIPIGVGSGGELSQGKIKELIEYSSRNVTVTGALSSPTVSKETTNLPVNVADHTVEESAERLPRALQENNPSVLVALGVLCQGFIVATAADSKMKVPRSAAGRVMTGTWWREPFLPIMNELSRRVKCEWGLNKPPNQLMDLVNWITGQSKDPPMNFAEIVREANAAIMKHLE